MKIKTLDVIDFEKVDALLEGFNKTTGFVTAILDLEGNVLSKSGWRQICTEFHRVNPETSKKCTISDTELANKMAESEKYHFYKCLNGLVDVAVPIIIDGEHVANLFSGQFFFEEPDVAFFKKQAKEFDFDEKKYLDALSKVPVVAEEKVKPAMDFLLNMTLIISETTFQKLEQMELNETIKESEEKFKSLFESANVGKSITLPTGEIDVNQAFCDMLGYSHEELENKKWQDLTPEEDIPTIQAFINTLLTGEKDSVRFEKRYICKNGTYIWADVSASIRRNKNGKPLHFITTIIDITGHKQTETEILQKQYYLNKAQEIGSIGTWELDLIKNELIWTKQNYKNFGVPLGTPLTYEIFLECIHPDDRDYVNEEWRAAINGKPYDIEHRLIVDGKVRWIREKADIEFDDNNKAMRAIGFAQDITERKQAEKNIIESEKQYRSLFENMNAGFVLFEIIQNEQGTPVDLIIIAANEGFEKTTGLNLKDAVGQHLTDVLPGIEKDEADWIGTYSKVALTGEATQFEQGSELLGYYYSVSAFQAGPKQCAVTFVDVTERRKAEELNRKSAERANMQRSLIAQLTFEESIVNSNIDDALKTLTTKLAATLQVDRVSVWLLSENEKKLKRLALYDAESGLDSQIEVLNTADIPSYFEALRKDSQVDADDAQSDPRTKELTDNYFIPLQISSLLDSAIQQDGRLIGVLSAEHRGPIRKWHADEKSFLSAVTNLVAQLFANAERKQSEIKLAESESRFRKLYEDGANGMVLAGKDFKFMMTNKTFCQMTGYLEEELQQLTFTDITHPDDRAKDIPQIKKMIAGEMDVYRTEKRYRKKDGQTFWAQLTVSPIKNSNGQFLYFVGIIVNVTKRKNAELDLRRMSRIMKNSQEIAHLGSFEFVAATQTTIWSEEEYRIYGLDPNGPSPDYNVMLEKCIHPDDAKLLHDTFMAARQNRGVYELEHRIVRPDGSVRWVYDKAHPYFDEHGNLLRYVGATLDITNRKRLQEKLELLNAELEKKVEQRTALLEASNKELKAFSYSVSHDLRAPLRHINGYVNLLNNQFKDELPEKAHHYLDTISGASSQMGTLIDDLLQYSRTGRKEIRKSEIDLNAQVKEVLEELKTLTKGRKITWDIQELPKVYGDYTLLKLVWTNLLDNAVKYTRNQQTAKISVAYNEKAKDYIFCVRDNGAGFDMKYAHKLFGVFQRLHSEVEFEGTGIGLANVQRIIHKHLGRVWAEAEPGKGAKFYFSLPINREKL